MGVGNIILVMLGMFIVLIMIIFAFSVFSNPITSALPIILIFKKKYFKHGTKRINQFK